jgi:hypothetical protein
MKKAGILAFLAVFIIFVLFAGVKREKKADKSVKSSIFVPGSVQIQMSEPKNLYFDGDGRKS